MTHYERLADVADDVGAQIGVSGWCEVGQDLIDRFADVTNDRQWPHVDHERSAAGPFGGTIAHGTLILSLVTDMLFQVLSADDVDLVINKGLDRTRFKAPVHAGERVRARVEVVDVTPRVRGYTEVVLGVTVEIESTGKAAMTSHLRLLMYVAEQPDAALPVAPAVPG